MFWWGGNAPGLRGWDISDNVSLPPVPTITPVPTQSTGLQITEAMPTQSPLPSTSPIILSTQEPHREQEKHQKYSAEQIQKIYEQAQQGTGGKTQEDTEYSENKGMELDEETGRDKYNTEPVPVGMPVPVEPENAEISDKELKCTLSVRCDTVLLNMDWLEPEKMQIIPQDGIIFKEQSVTFYEGESVFDVLFREMKNNKIHMEFVNTPIYNSVYIEGINNLYEFDCGELSGWMYKVNDWFPNYGCSRYQLKSGDEIEWVYTCNLGIDVGGSNT